MDRLIRILGIGVTVGLVVYAAVLLFGDPNADDVVEDAIAEGELGEDEQKRAEQARERMRMVGRGLAMSPDGNASMPEVVSSEAPITTVPYGSGEIDETTARDGFEYAMGKVGTVIKSRRRLSMEEWDALYRETNDAFSALSIVLDGNDEAQMAELELAHKRLKLALKRVKVRGRKLAR